MECDRESFHEMADMLWRVVEIGPERARPVLLLHGFSGAGLFWEPIARAVPGIRSILPDLPGHAGTSAPEPWQAWDLGRAASVIAGLLDRIGVGCCDIVGYSMGGRLALRYALDHPGKTKTLTLVGASPGIDGEEERRMRIASDDAWAERIEREGIESFAAAWEAQPLFATQDRLPREVRDKMHALRLSHDPAALASAMRAFGTGRQESLIGRLADVSISVLLLAGSLDAKYREIMSTMAARLARASLDIVDGSGHAVPLEKPAEFAERLERFLEGHGGRRTDT